jgi:hypothetical protein
MPVELKLLVVPLSALLASAIYSVWKLPHPASPPIRVGAILIYIAALWPPWLFLGLGLGQAWLPSLAACTVGIPVALFAWRKLTGSTPSEFLSKCINGFWWHALAMLIGMLLFFPKAMMLVTLSAESETVGNLGKLNDSVNTYRAEHGAYPPDLSAFGELPALRIYPNAYTNHRHVSSDLTVLSGESPEIPDAGTWCYEPETGRVSICCTGKTAKLGHSWQDLNNMLLPPPARPAVPERKIERRDPPKRKTIKRPAAPPFAKIRFPDSHRRYAVILPDVPDETFGGPNAPPPPLHFETPTCRLVFGPGVECRAEIRTQPGTEAPRFRSTRGGSLDFVADDQGREFVVSPLPRRPAGYKKESSSHYTIHMNGRPDPSARSIRLRGTAEFLVYTHTETKTIRDIPVETAAGFQTDGGTLGIKSASVSDGITAVRVYHRYPVGDPSNPLELEVMDQDRRRIVLAGPVRRKQIQLASGVHNETTITFAADWPVRSLNIRRTLSLESRKTSVDYDWDAPIAN